MPSTDKFCCQDLITAIINESKVEVEKDSSYRLVAAEKDGSEMDDLPPFELSSHVFEMGACFYISITIIIFFCEITK